MNYSRSAEADEPAVIVERPELWNDQADPRQPAAGQRRRDRAPVPSVGVRVNALLAVQVAERQLLVSDQPVIGDQCPGNGAHSAGISDEPTINILRGVRQQLPGLHHYAENASDQAAQSE